MKLNARQVDAAKPKDKPYKLADGGGLYLLIKPNGGKYWRLKYRVSEHVSAMLKGSQRQINSEEKQAA